MNKHSVIVEVQGRVSYPVFRELTEKDATSIAAELNRLNQAAGKATGKIISMVYRAIIRK